ncbi:MAG: SH3 domain-containing protein [Saprospiraceae bacterium]|nr:SH3 domain-containing protein [Saprospiraceae bacterium]
MLKINHKKSLRFIFFVLAIFLISYALFSNQSLIKLFNSDSKETQPIEEEDVSSQELGDFELPINGATGYASAIIDLKANSNEISETIDVLEAGAAFTIIEEQKGWWRIKNEKISGWVENKYCLINLPDVIPSIIYDNTNTYSSKYTSSGKDIPGITGESLYEGKAYNQRLGKTEYIMPVLYSMSKKISRAQQSALIDGNSLKIYEAFRPYLVQETIFNAVTELAKNDPQVLAGISTEPWSIGWFIAQGISNHQSGYAIDVSLVKIDSKVNKAVGIYNCVEITNYTEYTMPTPIHELSIQSATFAYPVPSKSPTEWKKVPLATSMNKASVLLQSYCTEAGLTPLASEWWHFNDLDAMVEVIDNTGKGVFYTTECYSSIPIN